MNETAKDIITRARAAKVSISELCREAGVARQWFEHLKLREPRSVVLYRRFEECLREKEKEATKKADPATDK